MQIILSHNIQSFTGQISKKHGYAVKCRNGKYYGVRNHKNVPPDGHWLFIRTCAQMAKDGFFFTNIHVPAEELHDALYEAHLFVAAQVVRENFEKQTKLTYDAQDILNLKITFSL